MPRRKQEKIRQLFTISIGSQDDEADNMIKHIKKIAQSQNKPYSHISVECLKEGYKKLYNK